MAHMSNRAKWMATLVEEAFNVRSYDASVSYPPHTVAWSVTLQKYPWAYVGRSKASFRLEFHNGCRWIWILICCVFVQDPFTKSPMKEYFNTWVQGQGPPQLFIYYQKAYKFNEQGEIEDNYRNQQNEFFVTDGKS